MHISLNYLVDGFMMIVVSERVILILVVGGDANGGSDSDSGASGRACE